VLGKTGIGYSIKITAFGQNKSGIEATGNYSQM
jgi:hypothetical protein